MKSRVFVIEDHALMRKSIIDALEREANLTVCGQAETAAEALAAIDALRPDLVLTDIQLKSSSGLEVIKTLRAQSATLPIVATTMFNTGRNEQLVRAAGASGFVSKQEGPDRLIASIQQALNRRQSPDEGPSSKA